MLGTQPDHENSKIHYRGTWKFTTQEIPSAVFIADRDNEKDNAIGRVRLPVCFHSFFWNNFDFCIFIYGHDRSSPRINSQGLHVKGQTIIEVVVEVRASCLFQRRLCDYKQT